MIARSSFVGFCFLVGILPLASQDLVTNQNAALILGQPDFTSVGSPGATANNNFLASSGIAVDPGTGQLHIADTAWHRVMRFAAFPGLVNQAAAIGVLGQPNFTDSAGNSTITRLNNPQEIHIGPDGNLAVADAVNDRVIVHFAVAGKADFASADLILGQAAAGQESPGLAINRLNNPRGVVIAPGGQLWIADTNNNRVLRFDNYASLGNGGSASVVLGQIDFVTATAGLSATKFSNPSDLAIGPDGSLWVVDNSNNRVLRFANSATITSGAAASQVIGQADFTSNATATSATGLFSPSSVAVSATGRLYVADSTNHRIVWFDEAAALPDGAPADGVLGQSDLTSNISTTARNRFRFPSRIVVDASNRVYVGAFNSRILVFAPPPSVSVKGKKRINTDLGKVSLKGTAAAPGGFQRVEWAVNKKAFKAAQGTSVWKAKVRLKPGRNTFRVRTRDRADLLSPERIVKIRRG